MITEHAQPVRAHRCYEGWSDRLSREAVVSKGLKRVLFGRTRVRRTREWNWQPDVRPRCTQFRYDGLNRISTIADASHGLTRFVYDENSNLLELVDAKGQRTTYSYDVMDRLVTRTDALGRLY